MDVRRRRYAQRLRTPAPWLFREAWADHARDRRLYAEGQCRESNYAEAWRRNKEKLRRSWEAFMQSILSPTAWAALRLLLERQHDLRWLWVKPGSYFFTKPGNPRKFRKDSLIPRITVTQRDRLKEAEHIYNGALESEVFGYDAIEVATLALAGNITGGEQFMASTASIRRNPLRKRKERRLRLWVPSRGSSLRYLCRIGFLQQPREEGPR